MTLALAVYRGFSWKKVVPYCVAQVVGAFLGAGIVYTLFLPVIDHFNMVNNLSRASGGAAGVFFTHPGLADYSGGRRLAMRLFSLAFLDSWDICDDAEQQYNEMAPGANGGAVMIGLLVALIGASMGYLEAWALNPARDFGPRLFCFFMGWGSSAFPSPDNYWWIPIVAPLIGGVIGGGVYQLLIRPFLPARARARLDEAKA